MSINVSASLIYGFLLPRLIGDYWDLNNTWAEKHRPPRPADKSDYKSPEWERWREQLRVYETTFEHVEIDWSGSEENEQYYVHCPCCEKKVYWSQMKEILIADLEVDVVKSRRRLYEFCDYFNLPKQEPGWFLAARYF